MPTRRGVIMGAALGVAAMAAPARAAGGTVIRIQHSSLQYSDDIRQHAHDAHALFRYARATGAVLVSGTESGNNSLHWQIPRAAHRHGYAVHRGRGEWVAVAHDFGRIVDRGYVPVYGPLGLPARRGGHGPRGIPWVRIHPHAPGVGPVVFGAGHWLTRRSLRASRLPSNGRMTRAVATWARRHGRGRPIVFYAADTNTDDRRRDVFGGGPLTSCWDAVRRHPATRPVSGRCIDVIAAYDNDGRVSCQGAHVTALRLFSDHRTIAAAYRVRP